MKTTYRVYADPGHAWLKADRTELVRLGIADRVSAFSYQRGNAVYLEEDCDLSLFLETKKARGESVVIRETHTDKQSRIRNYIPYVKSNTIKQELKL